MSLPKEKAWFAAKRYGYGWGLPKRWQGWLVLGAYCVSIAVAALLLMPARPLAFAISMFVGTAVLVAICAWKGETPKWHWGDSNEPKAGQGAKARPGKSDGSA